MGNKFRGILFRVILQYTRALVMSASRYEFDSVVRGFHEYQSICAPVLGEELPCKREIHNPLDSFAAAVTKDRMVIGHLPRRFSAIF